MAGNKSLIDIEKRNIDQYIITNDPSLLNEDQYKDSGNIIILTTDKKNALYIGDEHIASGYGFSTQEEADEILNCYSYTIPFIQSRIDYLYGDNGDEDNILVKQHKPLTIDTDNNKIVIDNYQYNLNLDVEEQRLSIENYYRPTIKNEEFIYKSGDNIKYKYNDIIYDAVEINYYTPFSLSFDYIGSYKISSCELYYYINNTGKNFSSLTSIMINDTLLKNELLSPDILQKTINISFTDSDITFFNKNISNNEQLVEFKVRLKLENNSILEKSISKWLFINPCIYTTNVDNISNTISLNSTSFMMGFETKPVSVLFNHGNELSNGLLYVPKVINGETVSLDNIKCILNSSNVKFNWVDSNSEYQFSKSNGQKINYYALHTPQKYKGEVYWTFSINR